MPSIYENLSVEELIDAALERNEGEIASNGALLVKTGKRTGRSCGKEEGRIHSSEKKTGGHRAAPGEEGGDVRPEDL